MAGFAILGRGKGGSVENAAATSEDQVDQRRRESAVIAIRILSKRGTRLDSTRLLR